MAQSIILKRSALQGKVPTTSSLSLGEIAINTYDGKIYLNRSGSAQSIQEIVTTNVVNTGSITLTQSGSFAELVVSQDGNFKRDLYVTRDVITNGSFDILHDVTASVFLGTIRATNGVISGSAQITSLGFVSSSQTINTGSLATTGSNSFNGNQTITGSVNITGSFTSSLTNGYTWVGNANNVSTLVATSSFGGGSAAGTYVFPNAFDFNVDDTTFGDFNSASLGYNLNFGTVQTVGSPIHFIGGLSNLGDTTVIYPTSRSIDFVVDDKYVASISSQSFYTNATLTASLQQGYTWVGNSSGESYAVATSSFGGALPSGLISGSSQLTSSALATTGSNIFRGEQTITGSLRVSGSLIVSGGYTQIGALPSTSSASAPLHVGGTIRIADPTSVFNGSEIKQNGSILEIRAGSSSGGNIKLITGGSPYGSDQFTNTMVTNMFGAVNYSGWVYSGTRPIAYQHNNGIGFFGNEASAPGLFVSTNNNTLLNNLTDNGARLQVIASGSQTALYVSGSTIMTGSLVVTNGITGSLLGTASFALNGSSNAIMYQTASAASVWTFNHFLATQYPVVTVYDNTNSVIIPQSITTIDSSSLTITFSSARTGVAVASKGGYVGSAVGTATVANALSTARLINNTSFDGTQNITILNLVSGSTQISLAGTSDYASLFTGIGASTSSINAFTSSHNSWSGSVATTGSNIFRGNQTITGSLFVSGTILQNDGGLALQDGTILYHSSSTWFIPTSTVSTSGTTATSVGTQFTSGMVGAKLTILRESKIITAFTSTTQVTVDSAYSQNYNSIPSGSWGVFSKAFDIQSDSSIYYYNKTGTVVFGKRYDSNVYANNLLSSTADSFYLTQNRFALNSGFTVDWTSGQGTGTRDAGIRRNTIGSLEIYDGNTVDGAIANRRDLILRNITGSNAFFSGSLNVLGTISATQYNVGIVSSSILYTSGSNKFGDTSDDIMSVTGSLQVTGSLTVNGLTTLSGSLSLSPSQSAFLVSHSISQSATVGATVYGVNITPLFTNVTASQTQTALRVMPTFTGPFSGSNTTNIIADFGATSVGSQFTITDAISGSIYMVNDISGLPIIEALSDGQVNMYDFPYKVFNKSGSYLSLGTSLTPSSSVTVQSDFIINKGYGLYSRITQASGSTVSNVTSSLFNLVFSNTSSSVFMSAVVTGYDTGSRQTVTGDIKSTIKYNAGVASVVGYNQKFINSEVANVNFDILASSVSASLLVYGSGSKTYNWGATITYQVI